jgi:hypothetical protein
MQRQNHLTLWRGKKARYIETWLGSKSFSVSSPIHVRMEWFALRLYVANGKHGVFLITKLEDLYPVDIASILLLLGSVSVPRAKYGSQVNVRGLTSL